MLMVGVGWVLVLMGLLITIISGLFNEGSSGSKMVYVFILIGFVCSIGGTITVCIGVGESITESLEEVKQKQKEMTEKVEEFEKSIKMVVNAETGTFDAEIISKNSEEQYYNVRSNKDLYRVYYKDWVIQGIEQNDKFIYMEDRNEEVENK